MDLPFGNRSIDVEFLNRASCPCQDSSNYLNSLPFEFREGAHRPAEPACSTRKIIIDNKKKFARPYDLVGSSCLISAFLRSAFLRSKVQLASYAFLLRLDKLDHMSGEIETV